MGYQGIPRIYPNLNPAAAIPVDREQVFHLHSFADNYRMNRGREHGQYVPNARFVFVTMMNGEMLLHPRFRHPALSEGKPVLYAGEASFNNGKLDWWSNGSGNYRPDAAHAAQAGMPMEDFIPTRRYSRGLSAGEVIRDTQRAQRRSSHHGSGAHDERSEVYDGDLESKSRRRNSIPILSARHDETNGARKVSAADDCKTKWPWSRCAAGLQSLCFRTENGCTAGLQTLRAGAKKGCSAGISSIESNHRVRHNAGTASVQTACYTAKAG